MMKEKPRYHHPPPHLYGYDGHHHQGYGHHVFRRQLSGSGRHTWGGQARGDGDDGDALVLLYGGAHQCVRGQALHEYDKPCDDDHHLTSRHLNDRHSGQFFRRHGVHRAHQQHDEPYDDSHHPNVHHLNDHHLNGKCGGQAHRRLSV